ncbi:MAG: cupin domain-containing protein [Woeseia sp.]
MSGNHFPELVRQLPPFDGPFDAYRLEAKGCDVLFAFYPAGTEIEPHTHTTRNCGVITQGELILTSKGAETRYGPGDWYFLDANEEHSARFELDTSEIEFWFK